MIYSEGDLALCTVEKIESTTVFVKLSTGETGTIIISEIAPGRIRNMREYVVPNKKIVCKILRLAGNNIELSLRRVTSKERKEVLEKFQQEHTTKSAIYQIIKQDAAEVEKKILQEFSSLLEFLTKAKEQVDLIKKYIPKEFQEAVAKLTEKKQREIESKKLFKLKCLEKNGISRIKEILITKDPNIKVIYFAAGSFQVSVKADDYKIANHKLLEFIQKLEQSAKQKNCELEIIEK